MAFIFYLDKENTLVKMNRPKAMAHIRCWQLALINRYECVKIERLLPTCYMNN